MFTGIVQGTARVLAVDRRQGLHTLRLQFPDGALARVEVGASIALAGTCLTVTEHQDDQASFDVIQETLSRTTLGGLREGDLVNFERAASFGDEIGGHLLSGHILETARVVDTIPTAHNLTLRLELSPQAIPYVMEKGYVALDGCSLTIGTVDRLARCFHVHLIPETLRVTTLGTLAVGDRLNVEVDAMTQAVVDTVERVMAARTPTA